MKSLIIFLFLIGIIFIIYGQQNYNCPPPRIEYRYIPRTLEQEELDRTPILATYGKLFTHSDPWDLSIGYPGIFYNKKESF